jgi:thiol-disulfide isomerase/thioredoxin
MECGWASLGVTKNKKELNMMSLRGRASTLLTGSFTLLLLGSSTLQAAHADTFTGKLVDQKGVALAGARVVYWCNGRQAKNHAVTLLKFSALTARDGTFAFNDFPTEASKKRPLTFGVQLPNGHLSTVTFRACGATATVRDQRALARFKVIDDHGKTMGGAEIVLKGVAVKSPDGNGFFMQQGEFAKPRHFKTGPDGTVRVSDLPACITVAFECDLAGYLEDFGDFDSVANHPAKVDITLIQGVTLRGRVTHLGKPTPDAYVQVTSYTLENNTWMGQSAGARTNMQGGYSVVAPAGSIQITARTQGVEPWFSKPLSGVHAARGTELDGLDLSLVDAIKVTGRVLEAGTETPVKNAQVDGVFGDMGQTKTTGPDGTFTMIVPPGKAQVRIQHVGDQELSYPYPELNATLDADHNPPLTFFIAHTALLPSIRGLEGVVKNADGQPVAGARIGIVGETTHAKTDEQGHFKFDAPINPGSKLYAVGGGAATSRSIVLLDQHHLDVTLDVPSAECSGNIVTDTGQPVAGAQITLFGMRDNFVFPFDHATSDANGRFHFSGVYAGIPDYAIEVKKPGFGGTFRADLKVEPGQKLAVQDLKIVRADTSISGKVLDLDGRPAEGIAVTCGDTSAITDKHGVFRLTNVPRGDDQLEAAGVNGENSSANARGGQTDVVIRMPKPAQSAPSTSYEDMKGQIAGTLIPGEWLNASHVDLSSLKGKIIVIDLWAVWCGPCIRALPDVEALYRKYRPNDVAVIGIHVTGTPLDQARQFVKRKGLTYPVFLDTTDGANAAIFPPKGIPQLYVVSAAGKIVCDTHDVAEAVEAVDAELKKR